MPPRHPALAAADSPRPFAPSPPHPAPSRTRASRAVASLLGAARSRGSASGQAAVELVVLLPVVLTVLAVAWQTLLAGQAVWEVRVAARAAARAHALGTDGVRAARGHLREGLERGLRVRPRDDGAVRVSVQVPSVIPFIRLGRVSATSHFNPQGG